MSDKLEKMARDIEKAKEKRDVLDKKIRELEEKFVEQENTEIHDMVREANLTPEQLSELIRLSKHTLPQTKNNRLDKITDETEDKDDEE